MPSKGDKKGLVILDHLNEFADKLLNRVADESVEGRTELIAVIERAEKRYTRPINSWWTGWFYKFTRTRGEEIHQAISGISAFPDAVIRLQEFKLLIGTGEWEHGSFNFYFFDELIKSIPGYEPLLSDEVSPVIKRLRHLVSQRIDSFILNYQASQKQIEAREEERKQTAQSNQKSVDHVLISNDPDSAKNHARAHPEAMQFTLLFKNDKWKLDWIDLTGKAFMLEPGEELKRILAKHKISDITNVNPEHLKKLKKECIKARDQFLGRTELLINPAQSNDDLLKRGVFSTFVLRGKPNEYVLYWINTLGNVNQLSLERYPQFKEWLNDQKYPLGEEQIPQLKAYLLHVNTSRSIGMDDFKIELQACLSNGRDKKQNEQWDSAMFLDKIHVLINPKNKKTDKDLSNQDLVDGGTVGTFILRGKPDSYTLSWINTLGKITQISLESYPEFIQWLNSQSNPIGATQILQLKTYLFQVNTSTSIGMNEFKSELQACLSNGASAKQMEASQEKYDAAVASRKPLDQGFFAVIGKCLEGQSREINEAVNFTTPDASVPETVIPEAPPMPVPATIPTPPKPPAYFAKAKPVPISSDHQVTFFESGRKDCFEINPGVVVRPVC